MERSEIWDLFCKCVAVAHRAGHSADGGGPDFLGFTRIQVSARHDLGARLLGEDDLRFAAAAAFVEGP
jgi:hypothetical protein